MLREISPQELAVAASQNKKELNYWLNTLSGDLIKSNFPFDYKKEKQEKSIFNILDFQFPAAISSQLINLSKGSDYSLNVILAAGLTVLLSKYTNTCDITFGAPIYKQDFDRKFINTLLVIRQKFAEQATFKQILNQTGRTVVEATKHYSYPLELLPQKLNLPAAAGEFPFFDVVILLRSIHDKDYIKHINPHITFSFNRIDETVAGEIEFDSLLYSRATIERIMLHYTQLFSSVLANPDLALIDIVILTESEKKQILVDFNDTAAAYPQHKTVHQLFEEQAESSPDCIAFVGAKHSAPEEKRNASPLQPVHLTYRELNKKSNQLAHLLREKGVGADAVVGIMMGRSSEMIVGLLAILKAGGAYLPVDPDYPAARKRYIFENSGVALLVTVSIKDDVLPDGMDGIAVVEIKDSLPAANGANLDNINRPSDLSYVIYTSGSSGKPKGVAVEHRNLTNLVFGLAERIYKKYGRNLRVCLVSPFVFDASVKQIFAALLLGHSLFIVPEDTRIDGLKLAEFYNKYGIDISDGTPTHIRLLLESFNETRKNGKVPIYIKNFLIGGEVLPKDIIENFYHRFAAEEVRITNVYGPTECCVDSISYEVTKDNLPSHINIPVGKPMPNQQVYIIGKNANLQPIGTAGELCIAGANVARGYLKNEKLTSEKFVANPFAAGKRMYKTGDLARWLADGSIEFLGRVDQQVKISGYRIEPGEIEHQLLKHEKVKKAVVIDREMKDGDRVLCAYIVTGRSEQGVEPDIPGARELCEFLAVELPPYMIPSYFIPIPEIPVTSHGKLNRVLLPEPEVKGQEVYKAPRNKIEKRLVEIWAQVLGIDGEEKIGINDDFFHLGGQSLKGTVVISKIHKEFGVRIMLADLFRKPNIEELALLIKKGTADQYHSIEPLEKRKFYALSSTQKRLYVLAQMEFESIVYNMPLAYQLEEEPHRERLENAFRQLITRHESFRTSFVMVSEEPVQRVHDPGDIEFEIEYYEAGIREQGSGSGNVYMNQDTISSFIRPFDLSGAPLLRVGLLKTGAEAGPFILLIDMHHIISDGISMGIFRKELGALYRCEALPQLKIQYKDYAGWQNRKGRTQKMAAVEDFWLQQFSGEIPVLNLPTDYIRPAVQSFSGEAVYFALGKEETGGLNRLAKEENATLFMILFALFNILLMRLGGQEDIVIGIPVAGRRQSDVENIIGMFVNTLALRNFPTGTKSFREFLKEIRKSTLEAFENQEYPFEELVERISVTRDAGRNPVFDVMFVLQNLPTVEFADNGLKMKPYAYSGDITKFDMTLAAEETGAGLSFALEYCTALFAGKTVKKFSKYFETIVTSVIKKPVIKIGEIDILSAAERRQILYDFNETVTSYPVDKTIPRLFAEQVERTPDCIALVGAKHSTPEEKGNASPLQSAHLTYRELDREAQSLARALLERGINRGNLVGIMVNRSSEMMVGILGILKSSCGYVPLNPKAPPARNRYMLAECGVEIMLTTKSMVEQVEQFSSLPVETLFIPEGRGEPGVRPSGKTSVGARRAVPSEPATRNLQPVTSPSNLAYVIFTSGSTGNPKGVSITHANLSPLLHWGYKHLGLSFRDYAIQNLAYYFDWSVWEIFIALTTGARLAAVPDEILMSPEANIEFMDKQQITVLHVTPTQYQYLVHIGKKMKSLHYLFIGAEKLTYDLVQDSFAAVDEDCRVFNMYGPTEATIISAVLEIHRGEVKKYERCSSIPIGFPTGNTNLLILDRYLNLCPENVPGELYIAGDALARGYLNDCEKTSTAFVANVFTGIRGERLYKTGDLAVWLAGGAVEFLGRVDLQVKIRGFRIELGEIESWLLKHENIKEAVVTAREDEKGETYLCAYYAACTNGDPGEVVEIPGLHDYLLGKLPDYMIPSYFIPISEIPLNPNGKVDLKALPEPEINRSETYTAPRDEIEKKLVEIWTEVLFGSETPGISLSQGPGIGIDDDFFQLGGHSLKGTIVIAKMHKEFHVKLTLANLFRFRNIRDLSTLIKKSVKDKYLSIESVEKRDFYELSPAQKRLYVLAQMEFESIVYNMPLAYQLEEEPHRKKLEDAFRQLIIRHESFRTSFVMFAEEPVQRVHDPGDIEFEIEYYEAGIREQGSGSGDVYMHHDTIASFIRPFDLSAAPLLRVGLLKTCEGDGPCILVIDMHHIISDGISMGIFKKELNALYGGEALPPLKIQYKDYAGWQSRKGKSQKMTAVEDFWLQQFSGDIPVLNLPTDYLRPVVQSFSGEAVYFALGKEETGGLNRLAKEENATLFMILFALFNILLMKLSGQEDIVIGIPVAGRRQSDLESIIGMFVNTLALRNFPTGTKSFREFLKEIRKSTLDAFENQEYPFEELVESLSVTRDAGRNPIFDVMFVLQNLPTGEFAKKELEMKPYAYSGDITKFDMTLAAEETGEGISFALEYCTALFAGETIKRFYKYVEKIVSTVIKNADINIGQIDMLSAAERRQVLYDFNKTHPVYPVDKTIPRLFAEQVQRTPDCIAFVGAKHSAPEEKGNASPLQSEHLTYRELDREAHLMARVLLERGINRGNLVGIMVNRSSEMMVGIIGILKSSCGYVPLNPKAPPARNRYMLAECGVEIMLTTKSMVEQVEQFSSLPVVKLFIPEGRGEPGVRPSGKTSVGARRAVPSEPATCNLQPVTSPSNLAYVIFTSGSTGSPKGVSVTHANLSPLLHWGYKHLGLDSGDYVIQNLAFYFDWSVWEIFITLTTGARLAAAPEEILMNPEANIEFMDRQQITVLHVTPTQYQYLVHVGRKMKSLRYLFIGAEKLTYDLVQGSFAAADEDCRVFNMYGPTEATIISAVLEIHRGKVKKYEHRSSIPIGFPAGNTSLLILDRYLNPCPVNIPGELYIAGDALANGYLNDCEKTSTAFAANVFAGIKGERLYKTGDLSVWLADGTIEFLGRVDLQVKIRGFRIELGEIESWLLKHEKIREAVVTAREDEKGETYLCAYYTANTNGEAVEIPGLNDYLFGNLPDYMIPSYFIPISEIPLNPNGKVDLKALPEPEINRSETYTAPRDAVEGKMVNLWAEVLGIDDRLIGIDDNFFQLGGHSLKATRLMAEIYREFNVRMFLVEFFKTPTIRGLCKTIKKSVKEEALAICAAEKKDYYPLSPAQKRFYILQQLEPQNTTYNTWNALISEVKMDKERLGNSFKKLIERHDTLRTSFIMAVDEPVQRIQEPGDVHFEVEYYSGPLVSPEDIIKGFMRAFDLSKAPLLRVGLAKLAGEQYLFLFEMHHIISDAVSAGLIGEEFMKFYAAEDVILPQLQYQYKDYSEWQKALVRTGKMQLQEEYWLRDFSGPLPVLTMPLDYQRPPVRSYTGDREIFEIPPQQVAKLNQYARQEDATMFMVLLAVFYIFLSKISGQADIIVGTPTVGRRYAELYNIVGVFINTLALRNYPDEEKSFDQFIKEVKQRTLEAFDNQDYQFEELVDRVLTARDSSRNPLFDVLYNYVNVDEEAPSGEEDNSGAESVNLNLRKYKYRRDKSMLDLLLNVKDVEKRGKLICAIAYCTELFKRETIEQFVLNFKEIINAVTANKHILLKEIKISHNLAVASSTDPGIEFGF